MRPVAIADIDHGACVPCRDLLYGGLGLFGSSRGSRGSRLRGAAPSIGPPSSLPETTPESAKLSVITFSGKGHRNSQTFWWPSLFSLCSWIVHSSRLPRRKWLCAYWTGVPSSAGSGSGTLQPAIQFSMSLSAKYTRLPILVRFNGLSP